MELRLDYRKFSSEPIKALYAIEIYLEHCSIEPRLLHLLKLRAFQINGCAFCIDMHSKDARALGETEQRLYELNAWRETPFYTDRERAALEWTEALTLVWQTHAPDESYERLRQHFSDQEIMDLTYVVSVINTWNRIAIGLRAVPGHYQPKSKTAATS
jgi:AhpD family alkylhydroperoxidase